MAIRPIILHPDPRLKKVCEPVGRIDSAIRSLASDMLATMYDAPGVGLAAPQVGVLTRLFVMDCAGKDAPPDPMVLINPEILALGTEMVVSEEGCLSVPDFYEDVTRPGSATLRWTTLEGAEATGSFTGLAAKCVQHEIDHLNGRMFLDHLSALKRSIITKKMIKLKRERALDAV
jgi:peptide deformylase